MKQFEEAVFLKLHCQWNFFSSALDCAGKSEERKMDAERVSQLRDFVRYCKSDPSLLHDPSLLFFRDYLESLGAKIPTSSTSKCCMRQESEEMPNDAFGDCTKPELKIEDSDDDKIVESDLELEGEVVEIDSDYPQKMEDSSVEVTEESRDAAQISKAKAADAMSEGKLEEAIEHLTDAIALNPFSAILYATRASVFVKMRKPNASIRDANAALQVNPDLAKGYKSRGMANALLGKWKEAASDLYIASKLDHDEEIQSVLNMVVRNTKKIDDHQKRYESLRKEKEQAKGEEQNRHYKVEQDEVGMDYLAALQGTVLIISSSSELKMKLEAAAKLSRLIVLYFTAMWCGPCRFMAPVYKDLAERHPKVAFLKVDIDELSDVAHQWNVGSVPTFFFVKDCKEIDKVVGADKVGLERKIALLAPKA